MSNMIKIGKISISEDAAKSILAFFAGKNHEQIGAFLIKVGKAFQSGGASAAAGTLAIGGLKGAALVGAVAYAYNFIKGVGNRVNSIIKDEDKSVVQKIGEVAWETWIPVATVKEAQKFGDWLYGLTLSGKQKANIRPGMLQDVLKILKDNSISNKDQAIKSLISMKYNTKSDRDAKNVKPSQIGDDYNHQLERENESARESGMVEWTGGTDNPGYREWQNTVQFKSRGGKDMPSNNGNRSGLGGTNDPKWYTQGKFNTSKSTGTLNWDQFLNDPAETPFPTDGNTTPKYMGVPAVAAMNVMLTIGHAYNDLMDVTFTSITDNVKALNQNQSFTGGWSKWDLINYIHMIRLAYAGWLQGCRAYKLVNEYSGHDLTMPYAIFAAIGLDYTSFQAARAQIKEDLRTLEAQLSVINIEVSKLDLINRTRQMFMNGFKDAKSPKGQVTVCTPFGSYYADPDTGTSTAFNVASRTISSGTTGMAYSTWLTNMRTIISKLVDTPKLKNMLICFRKVLGTSEGLFKVPADSEKFEFKYDKEMMMQIENACIPASNASGLSATLVSGSKEFASLTETCGIPTVTRPKYLNSHCGKLNKDLTIVAQRLQCWSDGTNSFWGTEVPYQYDIIYTVTGSANIRRLERFGFNEHATLNLYSSSSFGATDRTDVWKRLQEIAVLSTFDWSPQIRFDITVGSITSTAGSLTFPDFEVNTDWEDYAISFGVTMDTSKVFLHNMKNANYSLYAYLQTRVDYLLDNADTASTKAAKNVKFRNSDK